VGDAGDAGEAARERDAREAPDPEPRRGWTAVEVAEEFPELALVSLTIAAPPVRRSPRVVRERLRQLSNRFHGAQAIALRQEPVAGAYRIFFRHIGLDPDRERTPLEAAVLERMMRGGFASSTLLDDALLIGLVETGAPVWALDADAVEGPLGIRAALEDEPLGRGPGAPRLTGGRLVVADDAGPLAVLFGELAPGHAVGDATRRLTLFSVQVAGVPSIHVEEVLWSTAEILGPA
jgi:DNA/RNA-binding domain of Phe-tRNA-synthetase-like protein